MLKHFERAVILQNVDDPNKDQESLALVICSWDTTVEVGVDIQRFWIQFSLCLIQVVDAQEKRVVHIIVTLKKAAVSLYGRHQCCIGLGVNLEAFWDLVKEIKILEGWRFLCPFLCGCLIKTEEKCSSNRRMGNTFLPCVDPLRSNFKCIFTPEGKRFFITTSLIFF